MTGGDPLPAGALGERAEWLSRCVVRLKRIQHRMVTLLQFKKLKQ